MKYAECPTVEVEIDVAAPPDAVWALVTDIEVPARFSPEFQGAAWTEGADGPVLGARFVGRNRHPARGEWETTSTVVELEPGRCFGWAVGDVDHPSARWRFEIEERPGGSTLRQWAQMGPGPSGLTFAIEAMPEKEERIVARRLEEWRENMQANLDGIKALAEGSAPT